MFNKKGSPNTHCASLQFSLATLKIFNVLIVKRDYCNKYTDKFQKFKTFFIHIKKYHGFFVLSRYL